MIFCLTTGAVAAAKAIAVAKVLAGVGAILISVQSVSDNIKAYKS